MRASRRGLVAAALALAALAALPIAALVLQGIAPGAGATWTHLGATVLPGYVGNTLALAVLVGAGVAFGGTITAWLVAYRRFPGSAWFEWALLLPLAMPAYVMAYAYTDFLQFAGPVQAQLREWFGVAAVRRYFPDVRSLPGAAAMLTFTLYPYVYLLARAAFAERPPTLVEAARTLGLNRRRAFWRVDLPLARPAIVAGVALALMETLADFGTVAYFGVDTFTTGIYRAWFSLGDRTAAAQLATALLAFVVIALALERASRGRGRTSGSLRAKPTPGDLRPRLTGARAFGASAVCSLAVLLGFLLPLALLLRLIAADSAAVFTPRFADWAWNSFRVAALAAALAVALALLVAYAVRLAPGLFTHAASRGLALGYALPGAVLAVGVLLPLGGADAWLARTVRELTGASPGLVLTGTVFALIYAYQVRYFAVAWNSVEPGFARITPAMDQAAQSLGAGTLGTLARVHAPLLARSAAAAFLLVFVDVMKELPATLLMRPFNFDTLATQTWIFAKDERLAEAALPSLAIVFVGLAPILLLARTARRAAPDARPLPPGALRA